MWTDSDASACEPSAYGLRQSISPPAAKLPTRTVRTVGRDETVQTLSAQLLGQRFVTVVGPGVIGKTTVAGRSVNSKGLRRSETLLAEAQRLSQTGSFAWNPSSGEIYWSDETYRILEYERSTTPAVELLRQRVHPEDVPIVRQLVECASHDGREFTCEYRLLMPDGRVKHLHVVARAIRHDKGDVDIVGAVKDVTEQKWAQTERERLEHRLRQAEKMEAVGRRVGGIAHDLNNVLAGVLAYGEMLFEETPGDSKLKRYAQNVLTAATRGRELVGQILTYSRTQRGARVPVDLATVVAETLELICGSLPAGIRLEASAPEAPLVLIGDATQLHQVTMNLCSNAIQAMSTGGTLRVALETAELPAQALSHGTLETGRYVRLIVADSGSGMDKNILARIFEPFFTTKEVGKGTGLGLSLVYAIITDSGGAIDVQSAPQRGSTFTIYLPHSQVTLAAPEAAHTRLRPAPQQRERHASGHCSVECSVHPKGSRP